MRRGARLVSVEGGIVYTFSIFAYIRCGFFLLPFSVALGMIGLVLLSGGLFLFCLSTTHYIAKRGLLVPGQFALHTRYTV